MNVRALVFGSLLLEIASISFGNSCKDRREGFQSLPSYIGSAEVSRKIPYALYCDTVVVKAGTTTEVAAGTFLHFARPQSGNLIRVEGRLVLKGNKDLFVSLTGSLDSSKGNLQPGKIPWAGIMIEPGGELQMDYAGVWGAPIPVTAFSKKVVIRNSFFTGASALIRPDGSAFDLDPRFAAVNELDFSEQDSMSVSKPISEARIKNTDGGMNSDEKAKLLASPSPSGSFWTPTKVWSGLGILALASAGGAWWYVQHQDGNKNPDTQGPNPTFPSLPTTPN